MRTVLLAAGLMALSTGLLGAETGVRPSSYAVTRVAVVRQPGVQTYEELIDEFRSQVRAGVRVVAARPGERESMQGWLLRYRPRLILTVGQSAYDQVEGTSVAPLLSVLVMRRPETPTGVAVPTSISTSSVLLAFRAARPGISRIGALHGPEAAAQMAAARDEARLLGIEIIAEEVRLPSQGISRLRKLGRQVEGLWLVPDLKSLSPQVLQYALMLQFRQRIPLLGATRRHTMQGALFALDHDPIDLGRHAAALANQMMAGEATTPQLPPVKLSLNLTTAQRIGLDYPDLRRKADRVYQ